MIGQLLDRRYQVIRVLGAGGFGQTYVAQDTRIPGNPTCVVKHLKPASSDPKYLETARRLFQSEAETLARLGNHEHIPRLLAYFEENQEFYLVQEFIEGHPLSSELPLGQRWTDRQVIQLLQDVLNTLTFVHAQGVIHRDIKPDNIIRRDADNKLVLIDFGAIKQVRTQLVTAQGQVSATVAIGTPGYMPTEQGQGKPRPNSDIYALGMIGIQAVTGLYPNQLQEDINTGEVIWLHQAQISQGLADVLTKMTRYHFKDRYQSATEALQALPQSANPYTSPVAAPGYTPTDYATQYATNPGHHTPPQPPTPAPQPPTQPSWQPTTPVTPANPYNLPAETPSSQPRGSGTNHVLPLLVGGGVTAVIVAAGVIVNIVQSGQPGAQPNKPPQEVVSPQTKTCTVLTGALNVRSAPGGGIIGSVSQGTSLSVTGNQQDGWVEISSPQQGWVGETDRQGTQLIDCGSVGGTTTQARINNPPPKSDRPVSVAPAKPEDKSDRPSSVSKPEDKGDRPSSISKSKPDTPTNPPPDSNNKPPQSTGNSTTTGGNVSRPSPETFIQNYFSSINSRQLDTTWNQLSPRFQEKSGGQSSYINWWGEKVTGVETQNITVVATKNDAAQVDVRLQYRMQNGKQSAPDSRRLFLVWNPATNNWLIDDSQ